MTLPQEKPLEQYDFSRSIGGSAGKHTHGGDTDKPDGMPDRDECDHTVSNYNQLRNHCGKDDATIYIDRHIDVTQRDTIPLGDDVTLVGQYCDPETPSTGKWIVHRDVEPYTRKVFTYRGNKPPTFYGVYGLGPRYEYFDPDHTSDRFEGLQSSFIHVMSSGGTFEAHGCRFAGWPMSGAELGARNIETDAEFVRCTFDGNFMNHLGYGVQQYRGTAEFDLCFFDQNRHAIAGFGYPNQSYTVERSVLGPTACGHGFDQHCLANNLSAKAAAKYEYGGKTAGQDITIEDTSMLLTHDIDGSGQESFAHRGRTIGDARIENSHFWHESKPSEVNVQGNAYRQELDSWTDFYVEDCVFGPEAFEDGVGAPRQDDAGTPDTPRPPNKPTPRPDPGDDEADDVELKEPIRTLTVEGTGITARYWLYIAGDVRHGPNPNSEEDITTERGETVVSGAVSGGKDTFELAADAIVKRGWFKSNMTVEIDGEPMQLGSLISAEASRRFQRTGN